MRQSFLALAAVACVAGTLTAAAPRIDPAVAKAIADPRRSPENRARDRYRHPAETLAFFGVKPGQKIAEFIPGGGWYAEILGRLPTGASGSYTAVVPSPRAAESATKLLAAKGITGTVATIDPATGVSTVPANSQDVVLTFRNVHNLTMQGGPNAANVFRAFNAMLKPGGTLGIVEHRLPAARDAAAEAKSGYLKRATVVKLATDAGFRLAGESEVNANPRDTADWPDGVWTLPPNFALKDKDRAKYAAIGESDRMTLKFVKAR